MSIVIVASVAPLNAQEKPKRLDERRERINKVWDEQLARRLHAHVTAQCKAEAAKTYSAIRFDKRRSFVEECVSNRLATAATPAPASHQAQ